MLTAFTASLLLITISELGDKTFFIAAILAMRHSRRWVFVGAASALATMTVLSVLMGQAATFLPPQVLKWAEVELFLLFGIKLLTGGTDSDYAEPDHNCVGAAFLKENRPPSFHHSPRRLHLRDAARRNCRAGHP